MTTTTADASTPLTAPPTIGTEVTVHGVPHTVTAIEGPMLHLDADPDARGNVPRTRLRWAHLYTRPDGAITTPAVVQHDSTAEGDVAMAEDDPRQMRLRGDAEHWVRAKERRAAFVFEDVFAAKKRAGLSDSAATTAAASAATAAAALIVPPTPKEG